MPGQARHDGVWMAGMTKRWNNVLYGDNSKAIIHSRYKTMSIKPITSLLLFSVLTISTSAIAQESSSTKEKLAAVNAQIEATTKENEELKAQLADIQDQIEELKRQSQEKEDELNMLKKEAGDSED